jgi:hypothetical protein
VEDFSGFLLIIILQGGCRAVLYTSQTAVAFFVDTIKRHLSYTLFPAADSGEIGGGLKNLGVADQLRSRVFQRRRLADLDAFRIASAKGAFKGLAPVFGETHIPHRAGGDTHLTTDTFVMKNDDPVQLGITDNGLGGTGRLAQRVFTLHTGCGQKKGIVAGGLDNPNTGPSGIFDPGVF